MDLAPKTRSSLRMGEDFTIPIEDVEVGDIIRVKPR